MNPKVEEYIEKQTTWKGIAKALRMMLLDSGLEEDFKWRAPCYTLKGKNVIIIGGFKEYFALSFLKGVLLQDEAQLLQSPGENSQSVKLFKFRSIDEVKEHEEFIRQYIFEAIEVEKSGVKIERKSNDEIPYPDELIEKMHSSPQLKESFEALTPGRKRAYIMFFESAKQSKTRFDRIDKYTPRILKGKGMNDCICGLSKRMPNCDGSHKSLG